MKAIKHQTNEDSSEEQKNEIVLLAPTGTARDLASSEANCPPMSTPTSNEVDVEPAESKHSMSDETTEQGRYAEDDRNTGNLDSDVEAATTEQWQYLPSDAVFDAVCAICCEEYKEGEEICHSQNPSCCHFFHFECMGQWLMLHSNCPCCQENYLCEQDEEEEEKIDEERGP
jgi:hypothetical protein